MKVAIFVLCVPVLLDPSDYNANSCLRVCSPLRQRRAYQTDHKADGDGVVCVPKIKTLT
jgi:hypothetical protein